MVWPRNNGVWGTASHWYTVTQSTAQGELNDAIDDICLSLKAGDQIFFVAKRKTANGTGTMFAAVPVVYY